MASGKRVDFIIEFGRGGADSMVGTLRVGDVLGGSTLCTWVTEHMGDMEIQLVRADENGAIIFGPSGQWNGYRRIEPGTQIQEELPGRRTIVTIICPDNAETQGMEGLAECAGPRAPKRRKLNAAAAPLPLLPPPPTPSGMMLGTLIMENTSALGEILFKRLASPDWIHPGTAIRWSGRMTYNSLNETYHSFDGSDLQSGHLQSVAKNDTFQKAESVNSTKSPLIHSVLHSTRRCLILWNNGHCDEAVVYLCAYTQYVMNQWAQHHVARKLYIMPEMRRIVGYLASVWNHIALRDSYKPVLGDHVCAASVKKLLAWDATTQTRVHDLNDFSVAAHLLERSDDPAKTLNGERLGGLLAASKWMYDHRDAPEAMATARNSIATSQFHESAHLTALRITDLHDKATEACCRAVLDVKADRGLLLHYCTTLAEHAVATRTDHLYTAASALVLSKACLPFHMGASLVFGAQALTLATRRLVQAAAHHVDAPDRLGNMGFFYTHEAAMDHMDILVHKAAHILHNLDRPNNEDRVPSLKQFAARRITSAAEWCEASNSAVAILSYPEEIIARLCFSIATSVYAAAAEVAVTQTFGRLVRCIRELEICSPMAGYDCLYNILSGAPNINLTMIAYYSHDALISAALDVATKNKPARVTLDMMRVVYQHLLKSAFHSKDALLQVAKQLEKNEPDAERMVFSILTAEYFASSDVNTILTLSITHLRDLIERCKRPDVDEVERNKRIAALKWLALNYTKPVRPEAALALLALFLAYEHDDTADQFLNLMFRRPHPSSALDEVDATAIMLALLDQIQRRPMSIDFVVVLCRVWLGIVTTNMAFTLFMSAHAYFAKQCRHIIDGSVKAIFTLAHSSAGSYTSPDLWMRLRLVRRVEHVINTQVMNHNVEGARDTMRQLQQAGAIWPHLLLLELPYGSSRLRCDWTEIPALFLDIGRPRLHIICHQKRLMHLLFILTSKTKSDYLTSINTFRNLCAKYGVYSIWTDFVKAILDPIWSARAPTILGKTIHKALWRVELHKAVSGLPACSPERTEAEKVQAIAEEDRQLRAWVQEHDPIVPPVCNECGNAGTFPQVGGKSKCFAMACNKCGAVMALL